MFASSTVNLPSTGSTDRVTKEDTSGLITVRAGNSLGSRKSLREGRVSYFLANFFWVPSLC
jgi:hypothetical protein